MSVRTVIGVDIGGTKIAVARVGESLEGEVLTAPTPRDSSAILATVTDLARRAAGAAAVFGVGVGSAGTFDGSGAVTHATDLLPGWTGTPVAAALAEALGLPAVALNDVHAAALAESQRGAGAGFTRVLVAAVGTGIGGAFVNDGSLDRGRTGSAGSLGHLRVAGVERVCSCGAIGHAEAVASGPGMERTYRERGGENLGLREIAALARAGDTVARSAIDEGAVALGRALVSAATISDPDMIVIGGGVSELGGLLFDGVTAVYRAEALAVMRDVPIRPAALGIRATLIGGAIAIQQRLDAVEHPS